MAKCAACESTILLGGERFHKWLFCNNDCREKFKIGLTNELVEPAVVAQHIREVFNAECPVCKKPGPLDCFSSTTVTGMVVAFSINSESKLCCASCGRMRRLSAFAHCLFLGWWSPKALVCNVFVLPTNLIAAAFVRVPKAPTVELINTVKARIGESVAAKVAAQQ